LESAAKLEISSLQSSFDQEAKLPPPADFPAGSARRLSGATEIFRLHAKLVEIRAKALLRYQGRVGRIVTLVASTTAACLLLIGFAWWELRSQLLRPIAHLREGLDRVAEGQLQQRLKLMGGVETRYLLSQFNAMTGFLELVARANEAAQLMGTAGAKGSYRGVGVFDEELLELQLDTSFAPLLGLDSPAEDPAHDQGAGQLEPRRHLNELIPYEGLAKLAREVLTGGQAIWRLSFTLSSGQETRWISLRRETSRSGEARLLAILENPSEIVHHAELEALQAAALESVADAVMVTDLQGRIEMVNAAFTRVTGYSSQEVLGKTPRFLNSGLALPEVFEGMWSTIASGQRWTGWLINKRKDGSLYEQLMSISPVAGASPAHGHYVAVQQDISEVEASKAKLKASETSFRALIEESPDAVAVHRDGKFIFVNRALCQIMGYSEADLIGLPAIEIVHPADRAVVGARMKQMLETGTPLGQLEERLVRKDKSTLIAEVGAWPTTFEGESAVMVLARDITLKKRLASRAMAADRLAAVGTLAAGVGHEINNPLAYLNANLEYMQDVLEQEGPEGLSREEAQEILAEARDGARRIAGIVSHLKALRLESSGRLDEEIDLESLIKSTTDLAGNTLRHRAVLELSLSGLPTIQGDPAGLSQVFINLITNAAQAIPEGDASKQKVSVSGQARGREVILEIRDTGVGIASSDLPSIFDPFFTTRGVGEGTGLGLSQSRQIVEAHGGVVEIASVVNVGTTVTLTLPILQTEVSENAAATKLPLPQFMQKPKILVIDDDPPVGRSLERVLASVGEVQICERGQEALQRLQSGERFDVILCDLMMPDLTGMSLHEKIESSDPELARRMLFITGGAFTPEAKLFAEANSDRLLRKPFDLDEVRRRVLFRVEECRSTEA